MLSPTLNQAPHDLLFEPVLEGWACQAEKSSIDHSILADGCYETTLQRWQIEALYTLHLRALACHVRLLSGEGALRGQTPEERYLNYCNDFHARHAPDFDECFEPLIRWRSKVLRQHEQALEALVSALEADRDALSQVFEISRHAVVTGIDSSGDTHPGAKRVCIITFETGEHIVYKPRSVSGETGWFRLSRWLSRRSPFTFPAARALDRGGHGWVEYVAALPSVEEQRLFNDPTFLRTGGALTALFHALNAKDMHRENLRVTPDGPLPLDLETVLHTSQPAGQARKADDVFVAHGASVSASGILPSAIQLPDAAGPGWADVGFFATEGGGGSGLRVLTVSNPFRDDLRLSFEAEEWEHPYESRSKQESARAARAVADGFEDAYRWLMAHRESFEQAATDAFKDAKLRYLNAQTQDYINVLRLSCAAEAVADEPTRLARLRQVAALFDNPVEVLTEAETEQLWLGHVPMFTMRADEAIVRGPEGEALADVVDSPLAAARNKIARLGEADLREQLDLIWAAFVALHPDNHLASERTAPASTRSGGAGIAALATELADDLVSRVRPDGLPHQAPTWLGPVPSADMVRPWAPGALGFDVYTGRIGVALALAHAAVALDHVGARRVAERIFDAYASSLEKEPEQLSRMLGAGCWSGANGIPLVLARAGTLLGRPDWREAARLGVERIPAPETLDIIDGLAGDVLSRLGASSRRPDDARRLLSAVLAAPDDDATLAHSGYAHGVAGILHALADAPLPDAEVAPAMTRALDNLARLRCPDTGSWRVSAMSDSSTATAWCHGAPGIALGVAAAHLARPRLVPGPLVDKAVDALAVDGFGRNLTLCHGDPGNWAIAHWIAQRLGHDRARELVTVGSDVLSPQAIRAQIADRSNRNSLNDTFMVGRSGVLFHLTTRLAPELGSAPLTPV